MKPDIQQLLRQHLTGTPTQRRRIEANCEREEVRRRARLIALKGLKLARNGYKDLARAALFEVEELEQKWRQRGGKGKFI